MTGSTNVSFVSRLDAWRQRHVSDRELVLVLAFMVGFLASLAAYVLHFIIHEIKDLITSGFQVATINWLYLLYPVIGIWLTSLFVKYVVRDNISHGITRVLYAISTKQSRLKGHNTWSSIVASAITIGFGGSVGAEAPIVLTGSAIGSNLGKIFHLDNRTLMLLVGCGIGKAICFVLTAVLVLRHIAITQQDFLLLQGYLPNMAFYGETILSFLTETVVFGVFLTDCGIKSTDSWSYLVVVVFHIVAEYHNLGKVKKTPVFGIYEALFHTVGFRQYSFVIVFFIYFDKSQR